MTVARPLVAAATALLLSTPALRADVLTVGPTGDFTTIQAALDASLPGDTVLVAGGQYGDVTVNGQGVSIVAELGAVVEITGGLAVLGVPAGETVELVGLRVVPVTGVSVWNTTLLLNCEGAVRVEDCELLGKSALLFEGDTGEGAVVDGCDDVSFAFCTIEGGSDAIDPVTPANGPAGLLARDSTVAVWACDVTGGVGGTTTSFGSPHAGGAGLHAVLGAEVFTSGSTFTGGEGGRGKGCDPGSFPGPGGPGGPAVSLGSASTRWRHQEVTLVAGEGGPGGVPGLFCTDPGPEGPPGTTLLAGDAIVVPVSGTARSLDAASPLREGFSFPIALFGEPGDLVAVLASTGPDTSFQLGAHGQFLLGAPFQVRIVGTVPGFGLLAFSTAFPELGPGVESVVLYTQPLFLSTGGELFLGSPYTAVVLDSAF